MRRIACWALSMWAAWTAYVGERDGQPASAAWIGCGAAVGVGFLFNYSILLIVPGLALFAWSVRGVARPGVAVRGAVAFLALAVCVSPVAWWNLQHDAAGLRHLLGYLELPGGDRVVRSAFAYQPQWTASLMAGQLGVVRPGIGLVAVAIRRGSRDWLPRLFARDAASAGGDQLADRRLHEPDSNRRELECGRD